MQNSEQSAKDIGAYGGASEYRLTQISLASFDDLDHLVDATHINVSQIGRGHYYGRATYLKSQELIALWFNQEAPCVTIGELAPGFILFPVPLCWTGELTFNGENADRNSIFRFSSVDSYVCRSDSRIASTIGLPRHEVVRTIAALRGIGPEDVCIGDGLLKAPEITIGRLKRLVARAHRCLPQIIGSQENHEGLAAMAETLKTAILDCLLCATSDEVRDTRICYDPYRIVRRAEDKFVEAGRRPISLADLCDAAGVSAGTLNAAFHSICGESPARYFKHRRLSMARSTLLNATEHRAAVKRAAIDAGLTDLGRFSVEYRALFGESPSATLTQTGPRFHDQLAA